MMGRRRSNLTHRSCLPFLALFAVLAPAVLFSMVQYRSLADIESKTSAALQDSLRQTLQRVSSRTTEKLEALAVQSLGAMDSPKVERKTLDEIETHLRQTKQSHPEISLAFVVVHPCPCQKEQFAVFAYDGKVDRVAPGQFKTSAEARIAMDTFNNASLLGPSAQTTHGALFEHSSCALFPGSGDADQLLVFLPLFASDGETQIAFAGIALRSNFIREQLLPQVIREVQMDRRATPIESVPVISVFDENHREVYASRSGRNPNEVSLAFSPVFHQWQLDIGYPGITIAAIARHQFLQNVLFTLLAFALLIVGLALMLRATRREFKLVEAKGTFVSNVSHELKTPLALIRLFAETLEMGRINSDEEVRGYGRIINRESSRLSHMIDNILDFSRIEAGRRKYEFVETDIGQVIEEVLQSCEYQLKSAGFEVTQDIQTDLPPLLLDREAIAQAMLNLVDNAIKYSADLKRIELRAHQREQAVAIEVTDYGIGIPRSEHSRIFEKFYSVSTGLVHDTKGSGLGLAIVRHIVEAHRGEIVVNSAPGKGSRFTILLPIEASRAVVLTDSHRSEGAGTGGYGVAESPHH
ncbi:MAG TPA: HAMP domain-containing sensor histidine kinase [Blastocatellia bacterium]|nr:HAMP domain-containing sensor histidine kinase [Blastocatellia bacterium]